MSQKSILVTGTSTGIGRSIVGQLLSDGHHVLATVRKEEDRQSLLEEFGAEDLEVHFLDLTSPEQIEELATEVTELDGLVNNAGIALPSPVLKVDMDQLRLQMEVNFFGVVHLTSRLLPAIIEAKGRIVMMSSVSGRLALPFFFPYASSKFALEAFSDSLRNEVAGDGVKVVIIEPGNVDTPIWDKAEGLDTSRYEGTRLGRKLEAIKNAAIRNGKENSLAPEEIASLVSKVLSISNPRPRYVISRGTLGFKMLMKLPVGVRDYLVRRQMGLG